MDKSGGFIAFIIGLSAILVAHFSGDDARSEPSAVVVQQEHSPPATSASSEYLRDDGKRGIDQCSGARALIDQVGQKYDVPKGLLYGVWQTESHGLCGGHGSSGSWQLVPNLVAMGGKCVTTRGTAKCQKNLRAMQDICAQTRNGRPICDPNDVRTSSALAMGPMQIMPTTLFKNSDGRYAPGVHAIDYDHDGVIDPHDLGDAMATAAVLLKARHGAARRKGYDSYESWQIAAKLYNGAITINGVDNPYYGGNSRRNGVRFHWQEWCEITSTCGEVAYATR